MTDVRVEIDDPVCTITLDRPETLNALTYPMLAALREAVDAAASDPNVVGIVVTGSGRGFCSGLDASVLQATTTAGSSTRPKSDDVPGLFTWLLSIPKPVISAVNGVAAGGGFVLTAMSDLRIASTAGSFTTIFSKRGLIAEHGMTWLVPRLLGVGNALDLLWSSRKIDAAEAQRIGLVSRVVPDAALADEALSLARQLANGAPAALAATKRLLWNGLGLGAEAAMPEENRTQAQLAGMKDALEGLAAVIEKRAPRFTGQ